MNERRIVRQSTKRREGGPASAFLWTDEVTTEYDDGTVVLEHFVCTKAPLKSIVLEMKL